MADDPEPSTSRPQRSADRTRMKEAIAEDLAVASDDDQTKKRKRKKPKPTKPKQNSDLEDSDFSVGEEGSDEESDDSEIEEVITNVEVMLQAVIEMA